MPALTTARHPRLLPASSGPRSMSIPTPEPRRLARPLPRPRACGAAGLPASARRWPACGRNADTHAPTLQFQSERPVF